MRYNLTTTLTVVLLLIISSCSVDKKDRVVNSDNCKYVDPFISTGDDHGQTDVAAAIPFGMVKPCPDTAPIAHSGYDFNATEVVGFSHTRFSGVGCRGVGGDIRVLPFVSADSIPSKLTLDKSSEVAKPGYYAVKLDGGVAVELTATEKVAFHKYIFPESENSGISIDLTSTFAGHISEIHTINSDGVVSGKIDAVNVCRLGKYAFYFALKVAKEGAVIVDDSSQITYRFSTEKGETIEMYCALSAIGVEHAVASLNRESELDFSDVKESAESAWNSQMSCIDVEGGTLQQKRLLYTHLYHATQSPFIISEEDGSYRGIDGKLYSDKGRDHYHGWSVWDTFRSKLPLLSLLYPDRYRDMMSSMGELYKHGKVNWATETEPFITVRTEHSLVVILDAYKKGLLNTPLEELYPYMQAEADSLPYVSPDNILESSYDLWALSEIATELDKSEDAKRYLSKAMEYKSIWRDKFLVMGDNSDVMHGDGLYEGTLWQYRWFVPFDITGVQDMMGGSDKFEEDLDHFFSNGLFNIGNQPDIQVPYLYAYSASPWKSQRLVNELLNEVTDNWYGTHHKLDRPISRKIFTDTPDGYIKEMDDDAGTMSAWYVWSSLGLYPVCPGSSELVISTPQFDKVTLHLGDNDFIISTIKESESSIYIDSVELNGKEHREAFINFDDITVGGEMKIVLSDKPNKSWGIIK